MLKDLVTQSLDMAPPKNLLQGLFARQLIERSLSQTYDTGWTYLTPCAMIVPVDTLQTILVGLMD